MRGRKHNFVSQVTKINYKPLMHELVDRGMTKADLRRETGLSTTAIVAISKGKPIPMESLLSICKFLSCDVQDVMQIESFGD